MIRRIGLLCFLLMNISLSSLAQSYSTFLTHAVSQLSREPAQEKVYLHLDKPNYGFGDTIWYKAYTVIGQKHQLSALSGVLYVELISPSDSLVSRQSIPLVSGIGWSDIPLSVKLKPGSYHIRAYTCWMRNFGPGVFDEQRVVIGGIAPVVVNSSEKCDAQFFPEGGELVNGVRCRVAVKAIGANGLGCDINGTIEDNMGNVVADFATQHLGMGVFAIVPEVGKSYRAKVNIHSGATLTVDLPQAQEEGYTLSVNNSEKDSVYIKIATNKQTLTKNKNQIFYIIAQSNGRVYYTTEGKLDNTAYTAGIAKGRFPEGIVQFTLFAQSGVPLAERIAFIDNKADRLTLNISTTNPTYTTRDKVKLELTTKDSSNKPVTGSFSIAVINESKVQPVENEESTILNNLLLTSELNGYIEQPNYYFTDQNDKTKTDLDLLMLTQGYRRYEWKQILTTSTNITYAPEFTQELSGIITTPSGKSIPNSKLILAVTKQGIFRDTTADENGKFTFTGLNITDTTTIVIRARKANYGSNVKIMPKKLDYPKIMLSEFPGDWAKIDTVKAKLQYADYQRDQKEYQLKSGRLLKTVMIKDVKKREQPVIANSSNLHGGRNADQVIMYDQMGYGPDLSSCLVGKVNFVTFNRDGTPINIRTYEKMAIIVDGITQSGDHLNDINANDVYSIEVLRTGHAKSIYGTSMPGDGALIITTKRGVSSVDPASIHPDGLIVINYMGFYKAKAFYSPGYKPQRNMILADNRSTIYWNPNILTDKDGKVSLEFYNNDSKGTYRVVVEGIDDDGKLGRQVYRYKVE